LIIGVAFIGGRIDAVGAIVTAIAINIGWMFTTVGLLAEQKSLWAILVWVLVTVGALVKSVTCVWHPVKSILTFDRLRRFRWFLRAKTRFPAFHYASAIRATLAVTTFGLFAATIDLVGPVAHAKVRVEQKPVWTVHCFVLVSIGALIISIAFVRRRVDTILTEITTITIDISWMFATVGFGTEQKPGGALLVWEALTVGTLVK